MFNYREIEQNYGVDTKRKLRHYESTSRKIGRYTSHLHFNLQCKHNNIVPKYARIPGKWLDEKEKKIIERTEKALLNKRTGDVIKKREELRKKLSWLKDEIAKRLPHDVMSEIIKVNLERQKKEGFNNSDSSRSGNTGTEG